MGIQRLSEVMAEDAGRPVGSFRDEDIDLTCPRCGRVWLASEALVRLNGQETVYECRDDHRPMATIRPSSFVLHGQAKLRVDPER